MAIIGSGITIGNGITFSPFTPWSVLKTAFDFISPPNVGTTWTDSLGSALTASITGSPTYDNNYGGGLQYSDLNTWVTIPTGNTAISTFTLSMAAKLPASASHYVPPFSSGASGGVAAASSNIWGPFVAGTSANTISQGGTFTTTQGAGSLAWYDWVYNGTSITVYQNGILFFSGTMSTAVYGFRQDLRIGRDYGDQSASPATFYRIKFQPSALTQSDVTTQYNALRTTYGGATLAGSLSFPGGSSASNYLALGTPPTIGAGSYTIEGWFRLPDFTNAYGLCGAIAIGGLSLFVGTSTSFTTDKYGGGGQVTYTVPTMSTNTWYHFALVRSGTTETLFLNGKRSSTGTVTNSLNYNGTTPQIGSYYGQCWPGQLTNFRVVVGSAVYDPTSTFATIPIGPLTSITNTKYLMLGANIVLDSSGVTTVTTTGSVTQSSAVKPF